MNSLSFLDRNNLVFPAPDRALKEPNGLLAIGGDLTQQRLLSAYNKGIFPWFNLNDPILWWSPDPRAIFMLNQIHISKSLKKFFQKQNWKLTINHDFLGVIKACAAPRNKQDGTWITSTIINAYQSLHQNNQAHSIEVWEDDKLIGGLYGLAIGQVFCGESMFHNKTNASKVAFFALKQHLIKWGFKLIDAQIINPHLTSLGATEISREKFLHLLNKYKENNVSMACWAKQEVKFELN